MKNPSVNCWSVIVAGLLMAAPASSFDQGTEVLWVPNISAVGRGATMDEARFDARGEAVAGALKNIGLDFRPALLRFLVMPIRSVVDRRHFNDAFITLLRLGSEGFASEIRNARWSNPEEPSPSDTQVVVHLRCDVKVVKSKGAPDPAFFVTLEPDRPQFKSGEQVGLTITPSQDCILTVYQIAGDSVRLLYPLNGVPETPILGGQRLHLPASLESWNAEIPEGWEETEDLIFVMARRDAPPGESVLGDGMRYATMREAFLHEAVDQILGLAPTRRAFTVGRVSMVR
jgi:hypothetical protein